MKNVQYKWNEVFFRNSQRTRLRGIKYVHHIDYASFQGVSFFKKAHMHFKKDFKKVKYVSKCTFNGGNQIDEILKENFAHSKNSIQTISLRDWYREQEFMLEENVDMNKILYCTKNLQRIRWEYMSGMMTKWARYLPKNGLVGLRTPLPKHFQVQFEFSFAVRIPDKKFAKLPKFQARVTYQGNLWKVASVDLLIWAALMKDLKAGEILDEMNGIERFSLHLVGQKNELEDVKKFFLLGGGVKNRLKDLKRLEMKAEIEKFSPSDFGLLEFPQRLEALKLRIETEDTLEGENTMGDFLRLGGKINVLKGLKVLDLRLPTTFYVNQMLHDMKEGMDVMEEVLLEFIEDKKHAIYEEFYVNSYVEWLATMPRLKRIRMKTTKLNYTYCSFLAGQGGFENLESIEWIDDSLERIMKWRRDYKTKIWVECKKPEDLGIVLGLVNEEKTESIEIPLVFDGLTGDFGLGRFMEKTGRMRNLKRLRLYVGFKLLEEDHIRLVEEFLRGLNIKEAECFVCYRELTKEARECMIEIGKRKRGKRGSYKIDFVVCPCP